MALVFPTALENFFEKLPVQECTPDLSEAYEMNENGNGEILTADLGARLWKFTVRLRPGSYADLERCRAIINVYRQAGRTFLAHPIPGKFPQNDPNGTILAGREITIRAVNPNMRDIGLNANAGAPFRLMAGDYISFQYGSNPTRYALHQVVNDAWAFTGSFEVTPNIRPGYAAGAPVQILRPHFKAMIVPGSVDMGKTGSQSTQGISFQIMQTLRN